MNVAPSRLTIGQWLSAINSFGVSGARCVEQNRLAVNGQPLTRCRKRRTLGWPAAPDDTRRARTRLPVTDESPRYRCHSLTREIDSRSSGRQDWGCSSRLICSPSTCPNSKLRTVLLTGTLCPIHTADADATKLFCRVGVGGVNTIRN